MRRRQVAPRVVTDSQGREWRLFNPAGTRRQRGAPGVVTFGGYGPPGWTCADCVSFARVRYSGTYRKCLRMRASASTATDIGARDPACVRFDVSLSGLVRIAKRIGLAKGLAGLRDSFFDQRPELPPRILTGRAGRVPPHDRAHWKAAMPFADALTNDEIRRE